jgi:transcriptional regulator with XRE-family HTH domain
MNNRIAELRQKKGLSQEDLAELVGTSGQQIGRLENGARKLTTEWMDKLAPALGVRRRDLLQDHLVPVVGYVGAGATMHYYAFADSPDEFVPMPENGNENTVAVEVRGSSLGSIFDTWLVYYDKVQASPTQDLIGKLCVVGLADDRVLVKRLRKGSAPGLYNLESNTEGLIEDVEITWAARVKTMTPR